MVRQAGLKIFLIRSFSMKIIGYSTASSQAFLTAPIEILVPWMTRLKTALGRTEDSPALGRAVHSAKPSCSLDKPASTGRAVADVEVKSCKTAPRIQLRVVREFDSAVSPDCAGRMVMSGRMADVCAELDRMALRGTAVH